MHLEGTDERGGTRNYMARLLPHSSRQTPTGAVILASQLKGSSMALQSGEMAGGLTR